MITATDQQQLRTQLAASCQACGLPRHMWDGIVEYVMVGRPVGEFLAALLANDLLTAVKKADDLNIQRLRDYSAFLEGAAPAGCYGSGRAYQDWIRSGGLLGRQRAIAEGGVAP